MNRAGEVSMSKFQNLYTINKTLRFGLKPFGKTLENFNKTNLLQLDEYKAKHRKEVQRLFDENFKQLIEERLRGLSLDTQALEEAFDINKRDAALISLKKQVTGICYDSEMKKTYLQADKHFQKLLAAGPNQDMVCTYDKFSTYFVNFFDIRTHIFKGDTSGSIAYRLIDENLTIFKKNVDKIAKLPVGLKDEVEELADIESLQSYNSYLTQSGITEYNELLGGIAYEDGTKLQGINEKINLYGQKNKLKLPRLESLYKMILSDRETQSFVLSIIENDAELIGQISTLLEDVLLSKTLALSDVDGVFIKYTQLGNLPSVPYTVINSKINEAFDATYTGKKEGEKYKVTKKKTIEKDVYSLSKIEKLFQDSDINVSEALKNKYGVLIASYEEAKGLFNSIDWTEIKNIKQSGHTIIIKDVLDALKNIQFFYNLFDVVEENLNPSIEFYNELSLNKNQLGNEFNSTYNKARNYLTKKEYSEEKFKLNFDSPTLADGWDVNKETANLTILLRRFNSERNNYDYFLGVWKKAVPSREKNLIINADGEFEKMDYKLYPDPSKMLPKQFVSAQSWFDKYPASPEFMEKYEAGLHKKGNNFDIEFLHELINRYKHGLKHHENKYEETFNFELKETEEYSEYSEFIQDVSKSNYKVKFNHVAGVEELVEEGKLYLFQIWSKDFSTSSKGTKNLNTIHFESLFSEENLEKRIFKLSGGAELFYRPKSLTYTKELMEKGHHYNELKDSFNYPIIKDKRYTEDKFMFHVPIQINYGAENLGPVKLNNRINENIDGFTHIIGIDRGERHLVYISVVDVKTGKIVEQKHLDEIVNIDSKGKKHCTPYLQKLDERSKTRDQERKSWEAIETIKELKDGYISQVVNEICTLQQKYNALIVMENLNLGFKRSRFKVEKQIYQKFETALIKKFNYIIDKKDNSTYLHGLQLANPIQTLNSIGKQSGIIFYIPAWNTSKIDPTTGFVNLLYGADLRYTNKEQAEAFINKLDKIYFEDGVFKFDIDFKKWNQRYAKSCTKWTLTSYGTRVETKRDVIKNNMWCSNEIDLTAEFEKILNKRDGSLKTCDVETYKRFLYLFKLLLQIRNSITGTDTDYMISPVIAADGQQFDSRVVGMSLPNGLPKDADANGAYNIARKGLMAVHNIKAGFKKPFEISNEEYLEYLQK